MPSDQPVIGAEEETAVDIDIEPRGLTDFEGMNAMRLRHPGRTVHVEMDDALRAAQLGHQHAAFDGLGILLGRARRNMVWPYADRIFAVRNGADAVAGPPFDGFAERHLV